MRTTDEKKKSKWISHIFRACVCDMIHSGVFKRSAIYLVSRHLKCFPCGFYSISLVSNRENVAESREHIKKIHLACDFNVKVAHASKIKMAEMSIWYTMFWLETFQTYAYHQAIVSCALVNTYAYMYICATVSVYRTCVFWCFIVQNKQTHATPQLYVKFTIQTCRHYIHRPITHSTHTQTHIYSRAQRNER